MELPKQERKKPSFVAADLESDGKKHLLLCASGSVATIKIPEILQSLSKHLRLSICLIFTKSALHFLNHSSDENFQLEKLKSIPNVDGIFLDIDEWSDSWERGGKILHIELRRWADIMLIAPLSANTQAKIVAGMADNLLTSVVRAWDTEGIIQSTGERKRIIVAPAMNTAMWNHPITKVQLKILSHDWGIRNEETDSEKSKGNYLGWFEVLSPINKKLACGDVGTGAMCEWRDIVKVIEKRLYL